MVTTQPKCHICGSEGEHLLPWASGDGEMRRCNECDFVFAWPIEEIDAVEVYTQAYEGHETRTQMDDYAPSPQPTSMTVAPFGTFASIQASVS